MIFSNLVFFRIQSVDHAVVWSCASVYGLGGERERQRERERERARVRARGGQEEGCDGARGIVWARRAKRKQGLKQGARDASSIHTPALSQTTRLHGAEPGESQSPESPGGQMESESESRTHAHTHGERRTQTEHGGPTRTECIDTCVREQGEEGQSPLIVRAVFGLSNVASCISSMSAKGRTLAASLFAWAFTLFVFLICCAYLGASQVLVCVRVYSCVYVHAPLRARLPMYVCVCAGVCVGVCGCGHAMHAYRCMFTEHTRARSTTQWCLLLKES